MKVLVVDDSPAIRARLVTLIRDAAPEVDTVEVGGAEEALAYLHAHGADVVVLDVHMPGMSGLDVLPAIKASPGAPVVIVLTSHPTELHRRQALALGADHFFDKSREFGRVVDVLVRPTAAAG